ncbi:MAG: hypothetical protein KF797_10920 [Flavobacteriales bacterium]|nr:hypothetical protein [Flavobacteriales bacterium]
MDDALRAYRLQAFRYWERGRAIYLVMLAVATAIAFAQTADKGSFGTYGPFHAFGILFGWVGAFIGANVCYSVVYLLEFLVMGSRVQQLFHSLRWILLLGGCLFGSALAWVIAMGLFREMRVAA